MLSSFSKLIFKITLAICLLIGVSALALHIWFVNNARDVLKEIVRDKSEGKFRLELSQLRFDFFSNTMQARIADISSTDTISQPITYHVKFRRLTLHVGSFWPLLFHNNLVLDSIKLHNPQIEVKQWHTDTSFSNQELSVPQEMGRMYHSMLDVLEAFGIRRIQINNARVTLINKMKPSRLPVSISDIYMDLFKTPNETVEEGGVADKSQSIDLRTRNQSIQLPGGRHRLAFKNFHLQLFRKRIQLDSCTITAKTTDSARSSYKIFFSRLILTGVDFDAMYRKNLIKADSVYCENPLFEIQLDKYKTAVATKQRPDANKIIRELTGDLDLAFVGVKDAGIRIDIGGKTRRSLYNSNRDDFQMHGLRINTDSSMPVSVDRFNMLVRDYHLYNQDSSATYSFDSIHFVNNRIRLSNFSAETGFARNPVHNKRDFKIRLFELSGLDWYELVFNETLKAREAYLYDPVISFVQRKPSTSGKKINLFSALQTFDDFMTLDKITVLNGNLDMKLSDNASVDLERVNFSLYSNQLLKSVDREGIRNAVDHFSFASGVLTFKDISAYLENVRYTGASLVHAEKAELTSKDKRLQASLEDIDIENLVVDDDATNILVEGLRWNKAKLLFISPAVGAGKGNSIVLKNIHAKNTVFHFIDGEAVYHSNIDDLQLVSYSSSIKNAVQGLIIAGRQLSVKNNLMQLTSSSYHINDQAPSYLATVKGNFYRSNDSIRFSSSKLVFVPYVNNILNKDYHFSQVSLQAPVFNAVSRRSPGQEQSAAIPFPSVRIDKLHIAEPEFYMASYRADTASIINIPFSRNSVVDADGFRSDATGIRLDRLQFRTTHASFVSRAGDQVGIEEGRLNMQLSGFHFAMQDGKPRWKAMIDNIQVAKPQQLLKGKNKNAFTLQQATMGNFIISSDYINNTNLFLRNNIAAWLSNATGEYKDSISTYKWYNGAYSAGKLSLDSLVYYPTRQRDSVIQALAYQKDYITTRTGPILVTGFKPEQFQKDSSIIADEIIISRPFITVFRDKQPPFLSGVIKPFPAEMIKNITHPVHVNRVHLKDGTLTYTEKNGKSRQEGTINLTKMDLVLGHIKNQELSKDDSLFVSMHALLMDSARIDLRITQAYQDSLHSFLMTLKVKPTSLLFLNPVLTPLSNIKIISGKIDSLHMSAVGREQLAFGTMHMFYRNLRIQLVKDGDPDKQDFRSRMLSFLANHFVIKRNNDGRTGLVYFERLRDRSFFNYIVKMTFSGMATSIGVKKNRKYMKQYKKALKEKDLRHFDMPASVVR